MKFFLIGFAGGIGVLLRFVVCGSGQKLAAGIFPLGTVIVNVSGCLLIGCRRAHLPVRDEPAVCRLTPRILEGRADLWLGSRSCASLSPPCWTHEFSPNDAMKSSRAAGAAV